MKEKVLILDNISLILKNPTTFEEFWNKDVKKITGLKGIKDLYPFMFKVNHETFKVLG